MFEKEAEEYVIKKHNIDITKQPVDFSLRCEFAEDFTDFQKGAEFGYNKATLKLRNCMNCKHRDTKGHSSCKDKGIVLCSHWEMKE